MASLFFRRAKGSVLVARARAPVCPSLATPLRKPRKELARPTLRKWVWLARLGKNREHLLFSSAKKQQHIKSPLCGSLMAQATPTFSCMRGAIFEFGRGFYGNAYTSVSSLDIRLDFNPWATTDLFCNCKRREAGNEADLRTATSCK